MEQQSIANGGLQYASQIAVQYVYLDFDGELTSYNGEILTVDGVEVLDSSLTEARIADIVAELNALYADRNVIFVTERPETAEYSTIFVGKTSAFDQYGNFAGLAETIDHGNENRSDNAFVMLDSTAGNEAIIATISHETDHLLGTLDHGGEGLAKYAISFIVGDGVSSSGLVIGSGDQMIVSYGGTAAEITINESGRMHVREGGYASGVTLNSAGYVYIQEKGVAENIAINGMGRLIVYHGGRVDNIILAGNTSLMGYLHVLGGSVNNVIVNSQGVINISSGSVVTDVTVNPRGMVNVHNSGTLNSAIVCDYGAIRVIGGAANNITIDKRGRLDISSCSVANDTVVNSGGILRICDAGSIANVILNSGGSMYIYSGGTATNVSWTPCEGHFYVEEGAYITYASNHTGIYFGSDSQLLSHARSMVDKYVTGSMYLMNDGIAENTVIDSGGFMYVYDGGVAYNTTIADGHLSVSSGGIVKNIIVNSGGFVNISSGGTATNIDWIPCVGRVDVAKGAYVTYTNALSGVYAGEENQLLFHSQSVNDQTVCGSMFVMKGGTINNVEITSGGVIYICDDGTANKTHINSYGQMHISNGGSSYETIVDSGRMYVSEGGRVFAADINSGYVYVFSEGIVNNTTINSDGILYVSEGGIANNTVIYGSMYIYNNGVTNNAVVASAGTLKISSGGIADNTVVNYSGSLRVLSGGSADSTFVNSKGCIYVSKGGTVNSTIINTGGYMYVSAGGHASVAFNPWQGTISFSEEAVITYLERDVNVYYGANSCGLVSKANVITDLVMASNHSAMVYNEGKVNNILVNQYSYLNVFDGGTASETTVSANGTLNISDGGTANKITVYSGGLLNVAEKGNVYALTLYAGGRVGNFAFKHDKYFDKINNNSAVIAENVNITGNIMTISDGGTASDTIICSGGSVYVLQNGNAKNATISSGGKIYVSSNGAAVDTVIIPGGLLTVSSGGRIFNTMLSQGNAREMLIINQGGYAENTSILSGGDFTLYGSASGVLISGVSINNVTDYSDLFCKSGGFVCDAELYYGGHIDVDSAAEVENISIYSSAYLYIASGGSADDVTVYSGGIIRNNGTGKNILIESGGIVSVTLNDKLDFAYTSNGRNFYLSGTMIRDYIVDNGGGLFFTNNAVASKTYVNSGGNIAGFRHDGSQSMYAEKISGGYITGILSGGKIVSGTMKVASGGYVSDTIFCSAYGYIADKGVMSSVLIHDGAVVYVSNGAEVRDIFVSRGPGDIPYLYVCGGGYAENITNMCGICYVSSNGIMDNYIQSGGCGLYVSKGGVLNNASIRGEAYIHTGGIVNTISVIEKVFVSAGAVMKDITLMAGGYINNTKQISGDAYIQSISSSTITGSASGLNFSGTFYCGSGAELHNTTIGSNGVLHINNGGRAEILSLSPHGQIHISSGGTAILSEYKGGIISAYQGATVIFDKIYVDSTFTLPVSSAWIFRNTVVETGGELQVLSGGIVDGGIVESAGYMYVNSGADVSDLTIVSGGYIEVEENTEIKNVTLASGASFAGLINAGTGNITIASMINGELTGSLADAELAGEVAIGDGATLSGLSGNFSLIINSNENVSVTGNDFSKTNIIFNGTGQIDLSGNYWGTSDIDVIYTRLGVDSSVIRIDDVLSGNPVSDVFAIESTDLVKNSLAAGKTQITITFSAEIDAATVSLQSVSFVSAIGEEVAVKNITVKGNKLTIEFDPIAKEGTYSLKFSDTVSDVSGKKLTSTHYTDTGAGIGDLLRVNVSASGPAVKQVVPAGDIAGIVTAFQVYFTKAVDPASLKENVKLIAPDGTEITPTAVRMITDSIAEFTVAEQTVNGKYQVFVSEKVADYAGNKLNCNGNDVNGEVNDSYSGLFNLTEIDLTIKDVQLDTVLTPGEKTVVSWNVVNESGTALSGNWTDGIYLSTDNKWDINDKLLVTFSHDNGLLAGQKLAGSAEISLSGVTEGNYYILVRSDIYNDEKSGASAAEEAQNLVATQISVSLPELTVGTAEQGSFADSGDFAVYKFTQDSGKAMTVELDTLADVANMELYIGYGSAPTRENYDAKLQRITDGSLILNAPIASRDVYVMIHAKNISSAVNYTLTADVAPLTVDRITQSSQDGTRDIVLTITGVNFTNSTTVTLTDSDGNSYTPENIIRSGNNKLTVTVGAGTLSQGGYNVVVSDDTRVETQNAVTIADAGAGKLEYSFYAPASVGRHMLHTLYINCENNGTAAIDAPLIFFTPTQSHADGSETKGAILTLDSSKANSGFWVDGIPEGFSDSLSFFVSGEVAGTLQPGETVKVPITYTGWRQDDWDFGDSHINWNVSALFAGDTTELKWSEVFAVSDFSESVKTIISEDFTADFGDTWGGYYNMVVSNMKWQNNIGTVTSFNDAAAYLEFEVMQKAGLLQPFVNAVSACDLTAKGNSIDIELTRSYSADLISRSESGSFGYGWSCNWDVELQIDENGDIQVIQGGESRLYQPTYMQSYQTANSDGSVLKKNLSGYKLTEADGRVWQFDANGRLLTMTGENSERISCAYDVNGKLSRLTNTASGSNVTFTRNEAGFITKVQSSSGSTITYTYNEDGDLLMVTDSASGVLDSYEYYAAYEHALTKAVSGTGTTQYTYDNEERIASLITANNTIQMSYGDAGELTLTAGGNSITLYYDLRGNIVRITDNISGKEYNYTYADGAFVSGKDSDGNVLGSTFEFAGLDFNVSYSGKNIGDVEFNVTYNPNRNSNFYVVDDITYYKTDADGNILGQNDNAAEYYVVGYDADDHLRYYLKYINGIAYEHKYDTGDNWKTSVKDESIDSKSLDIDMSLNNTPDENGLCYAIIKISNNTDTDTYAPIIKLAGNADVVFSGSNNNIYKLYGANVLSEQPGIVKAGESYELKIAYTNSISDTEIKLTSFTENSNCSGEDILRVWFDDFDSYEEKNSEFSDFLITTFTKDKNYTLEYFSEKSASFAEFATDEISNLQFFNELVAIDFYNHSNNVLNSELLSEMSYADNDEPLLYGECARYDTLFGDTTVRLWQLGEVKESYSETYILIHGNKADWDGPEWPLGTAKQIYNLHPDAQVLIVDWDDLSNSLNTWEINNGDHVQAAISSVISILLQKPLTSKEITIIGHSYGAHIGGGLIASGAVKAQRLIALDPAEENAVFGSVNNISRTWMYGQLSDTYVEVYQSSAVLGGEATYGNVNFVVAEDKTLSKNGFDDAIGEFLDLHSYAWEWFNSTINTTSKTGWNWYKNKDDFKDITSGTWFGIIGDDKDIQCKTNNGVIVNKWDYNVAESSYTDLIKKVSQYVDFTVKSVLADTGMQFIVNETYDLKVLIENLANNAAYTSYALANAQGRQGSSVKVWLSTDKSLNKGDVLLGYEMLTVDADDDAEKTVSVDFSDINYDDYKNSETYIIVQSGVFSPTIEFLMKNFRELMNDTISMGIDIVKKDFWGAALTAIDVGSNVGEMIAAMQNEHLYQNYISGELDASNNNYVIEIDLLKSESPLAVISVDADDDEYSCLDTSVAETATFMLDGASIECDVNRYLFKLLSDTENVKISLDANGSHDDEEIVSYSWFIKNEDNNNLVHYQIDDDSTDFEWPLSISASRTVVLRVVDNDGNIDYTAADLIALPAPSGWLIANAGKSQNHSFTQNESSYSFTVDASKSTADEGIEITSYLWQIGEWCYSTEDPFMTVKVTQQEHQNGADSYYSYIWECDGHKLAETDRDLDISLVVADITDSQSENKAGLTLSVSSDTSGSVDPNDKTVLEGVGEKGFVAAGSKLSYKLEFENDPEFATAPAQWVRVFDTLDGTKYDLDSFELQNFCIAGNYIEVGDGRDSFNQTVTLKIYDYTVTANISINLVTDEETGVTQLVAEFMAIDPATGFMLMDQVNGMLPVNDAIGSGEGYINYTINAKIDLPHGTEITNTAKIYFDFNDPIDTPTTLNTVDSVKPEAAFTLSETQGIINLVFNGNDADAGIAGYNVMYSTDGVNFSDYGYSTYDRLNIAGTVGTTYYFKVQAVDKVGNASAWSKVQSLKVVGALPENLAGSADGLTWDAISGTAGYVVEYSIDNFEHFVRLESATNSISSFCLPQGSYQWRVRTLESSEWVTGENIVSSEAATPRLLNPEADGNMDVFFANASGKWGSGYAAQHTGILNGWDGTNEQVILYGKNKLADIFEGSSDANILVMTDDTHGDALFVDDIYTALPGTVAEQQARIAKIDEIRAGNGDDIVDMTSQRFVYVGDGVKIYGGLGNDTIWANNGSNTLFGDAGDDRLVGGSGDDVIVGGIGDDRMHGGGGDDIFCFGGNWSSDIIEQLSGGSVTLWFEDGSESNWNISTLTYTDGTNSVKVSGISNDNITLIFGDDSSSLYDELAAAGCFDDAVSEKIFEDKNKGMLA